MPKIYVIGKGPAGVSAAIYAKRSGFDVEVVARDGGALMQAGMVENFYGFSFPITGSELLARGETGAKRLGVEFTADEILGIETTEQGGFQLHGKGGEYRADALILAAGAVRIKTRIPEVKEYEGRGVSYCAVCDGFFFRGKTVAVLGAKDYALHELETIRAHASKVYLLTNGEPRPEDVPEDVEVVEETVEHLIGESRFSAVQFASGRQLALDGLFIAIGTAGSSELARKVGAVVANGQVCIDAKGATNVPGLFAAGDATGGTLQISKAVHEGMEAGLSAVRYLRGRR